MTKPLIASTLIAAIAALSACVSVAPPAPEQAQSEKYLERLAFAQKNCGSCHAVVYPELSPNEAAPTFAAIINQRDLTRFSLVDWLANAHNYPAVMEFSLEREQVEMIADHMLTLRSEDYRPVQ